MVFVSFEMDFQASCMALLTLLCISVAIIEGSIRVRTIGTTLYVIVVMHVCIPGICTVTNFYWQACAAGIAFT